MQFLEYFNYLEPGTGSIIFQALIGAIAGVSVFGRRAFGGLGHKMRSLGRRTRDK